MLAAPVRDRFRPGGLTMTTQGVGAAAASQPLPEGAIREVLADWARVAIDGVAVLDTADRYLYVNPAGCRMLGSGLEQLRGRTAFFGGHLAPDSKPAEWTRPAWVRWTPLDGQREVELEYRQRPWVIRDQQVTLLTMRDVSDVRLQQRRIAAFATAAANLTYGRSLRSTLDAISDEVVRSADLAGAQIVLIDPSDLRMRVHGAAPMDAWPEHFTLLLEQARRRGAALKSIEAFQTRRPVVACQRKAQLLADPIWEPLHQQMQGFEWDTFVSVPLLVRGQALGALNAYYRPGQDPDDDDIEFLTAMADQAAVAVENARLLVESRDKAALDERHRLARELHDSACQQLFSLTLHVRAVQLDLGWRRARRGQFDRAQSADDRPARPRSTRGHARPHPRTASHAAAHPGIGRSGA
jgi:GAF domain-containing protein